jgi:hypothetical protein
LTILTKLLQKGSKNAYTIDVGSNRDPIEIQWTSHEDPREIQ